MSKIIVSYDPDKEQREMFGRAFSSHDLSFLVDSPDEREKGMLLSSADVLISWNPTNELGTTDRALLQNIKYVQLISAGYDHLKFDMFSPSCVVAANQGAYALPMAEHVLAMILSRAKKLQQYHESLAHGHFEQWKSHTKQVTGSTLGIIGFGSIGKETARLMRPFNVKVLALNTTGTTDEDVEFCGTLKDMDSVLTKSDFIVVSIPLSKETEGLIGKTELEKMRNDAILVNVARGPILKQKDLYQHLKSHPEFSACIDAWWVEPFKFGRFKLEYPFFELSNLLGSPHNSALVDGIMLYGATRAARNAAKYLETGKAAGIIPRPQKVAA